MKQPTKLKLKIFHEAYTLKKKKKHKKMKKNIYGMVGYHISIFNFFFFFKKSTMMGSLSCHVKVEKTKIVVVDS